MRGGIVRIVAAALVALLALSLAACGGDDDGGTSGEAGTTSSSKEGESQAGSGDAGFQPAPLRVSGEGAELREAAEAVHAFFVARARGEWDATCSRIAAPLLAKLEGLAAQSEQKGCAEFLEAFTTPMSDAAWREVTVIDADELRVTGGRASLAYRGAGGEAYSMPLREEDGEWKVEALLAGAAG